MDSKDEPKSLWRVLTKRPFGDKLLRYTKFFLDEIAAKSYAVECEEKGFQILSLKEYVINEDPCSDTPLL